jgi:hydroxypyruvate isomerase
VPRFSANLGFLWQELPLPERIGAAAAGFEAVECHFPYEHPADEVAAALTTASVRMISINTVLGPNGPDDFGLAAWPGREDEAQGAIDQALTYAAAIGAAAVNVVAGKTGRADGTEAVYRANLVTAAEKAQAAGLTILLEPLSTKAVPGYHFSLVDQAVETIEAVEAELGVAPGTSNVKVMFDCFHVQTMQGNLAERLAANLDMVGHIQMAAVPDRGAPDHGEVDFTWLFAEFDRIGYQGWIGAEYHPDPANPGTGSTEASLGWFADYT